MKRYTFLSFHRCGIECLFYLLLVCGLYACASMGNGPSGGDCDIDPPKFVGSNPQPNSVHFNGRKIVLFFDEYVAIENPSEKVIITPPQKKTPSIKAIGKKIVVELEDTLIANMTYTFDFTDGIVDNNEKNALKDFNFAFSTGDVVDSLVISGFVLNAENLEPMSNIIVGIHSNLSDTAFTSMPFLRISKTDETGHFQIRNIAHGTYHIFALDDKNKDFKFESPNEALAFGDSVIVPSFYSDIRIDTIWKDSSTVDTIREISYNHYVPDNILLRLFKEDFELQYLSKIERINARQFVMNFNSPISYFPEIHLINEDRQDWYITELSSDRKILTYWIKDSLLYQKDTLLIEAIYMAHDTLRNMVSVSDTFQLIQKGKNLHESKTKEVEQIFLDINIASTGSMEIFDTLKIIFSEPILPFEKDWICIEQKIDTLWKTQYFPVLRDSLNPRVYFIDQKWDYNQEYQITIDSISVFSIYGKWNRFVRTNFKIKAEEEYGHLYVQVKGVESVGLGQLLDDNEKVVKESFLTNGELIFENIRPGRYYLRYVEDSNGNVQWDTGNYTQKRQPEQVYYYPNCFEIKKYMEWEQVWNVKEYPLHKQKPLHITKNKIK